MAYKPANPGPFDGQQAQFLSQELNRVSQELASVLEQIQPKYVPVYNIIGGATIITDAAGEPNAPRSTDSFISVSREGGRAYDYYLLSFDATGAKVGFTNDVQVYVTVYDLATDVGHAGYRPLMPGVTWGLINTSLIQLELEPYAVPTGSRELDNVRMDVTIVDINP